MVIMEIRPGNTLRKLEEGMLSSYKKNKKAKENTVIRLLIFWMTYSRLKITYSIFKKALDKIINFGIK